MTKRIIAANWKMNHSFEDADTWLERFAEHHNDDKDKLKNCEIVVCPPVFMTDYMDSELMDSGFQKLETIMKENNKNVNDFSGEELTEIILGERILKLGGQDCHYEDSGSYTGDISADALRKVGCDYVILGHGERRAGHAETNEIVAKKIKAALKHDLIPIICVGENKETRDQKKHMEFVYQQIMSSIPKGEKFTKLVIAYEPLWSIGTGIVPSEDQIKEIAKLIKKIFKEKFAGMAEEYFMLYGGSVTVKNAKEIMAVDGVDGLLVGKVSLDADEFFKICIA